MADSSSLESSLESSVSLKFIIVKKKVQHPINNLPLNLSFVLLNFHNLCSLIKLDARTHLNWLWNWWGWWLPTTGSGGRWNMFLLPVSVNLEPHLQLWRHFTDHSWLWGTNCRSQNTILSWRLMVVVGGRVGVASVVVTWCVNGYRLTKCGRLVIEEEIRS